MDNLKNNLEQREKNELIAVIQHMLCSDLEPTWQEWHTVFQESPSNTKAQA